MNDAGAIAGEAGTKFRFFDFSEIFLSPSFEKTQREPEGTLLI